MSSPGMEHLAGFTGKLKVFLVASFCCLFGLLLIFAPKAALSGARNGLSLSAEIVIPSLFPFLCLTSFVIKSGFAEKSGRFLEGSMRRVFRLPGCAAAAVILGVIGGYPAGAAAVAGLCRNGLIKKSEGDRLLCFCVNSGPAFVIGAVGAGMFGSTAVGITLYAAHIGASLVIGLFSRFFAKRRPAVKNGKARQPLPFAKAFVDSISEAASGMLGITAFVVFFACVISLFSYCGVIPTAAKLLGRIFPCPGGDAQFYTRLLAGFFEVSNGCAAAAGSKGLTALLLTSAALSWSGLSVQCQVMSVVYGTGLSVKNYVLTRVFHIALALAFTFLLFAAFPSAVPAIASREVALRASVHTAPATSALLILTGMLLLSQLRV